MPLGISEKCRGIAPSATLAIDAKAKAMRADGIDVIAFAAGEPDFDTPEIIRNGVKEAMDKGMTHYTPVPGTPLLRQTIADWLERECNVSYDPGQIIVSGGAKMSLYILFQALLNPGDEVIIPTPCWVSYPEMVRMAGGVPVFASSTEESGFVPDPAAIAALITPRTKAFVLTNPSNPTGCLWSRESLEELGRLAVEKEFYIVSDEIYGKLVYDGLQAQCMASLSPEVKAHTVLINGVSKSFAMTGFRIGFAAGPADVIKAMSAYQSHAASAPNAAAQFASAVAYRQPSQDFFWMRDIFQKRRDELVELVNAIPGLHCRKPQGAFYVFVNHQGLYGKKIHGKEIKDSASFADLLLEYGHVAVVPGNAFMADGYCRLSYAVSIDKIREGLSRIAAFVKELEA